MPSDAGASVFTAECAIDAEPIPASLEKSARWNPMTMAPSRPPEAACPVKASEITNDSAAGICSALRPMTASALMRYSSAITGTSTAATRAID